MEGHYLDGNRDNHRRDNLALLHRHCHDQVHAECVGCGRIEIKQQFCCLIYTNGDECLDCCLEAKLLQKLSIGCNALSSLKKYKDG